MTENNFWRNRSVFVTGCSGFLGSWLVKELVEKGAQVVGLVRDWVPRSNLIYGEMAESIVIVRGEIEDYSLLKRILNEYEVETVFHLAAQTIVGTANRSPLSTFEANIKGTWNILEACRRSHGAGRVVIASSDKAYGEHEKLPYTEDAPLKGSHPYDVSKSCADLLALSYFNTYGLPVCVTRCGNFYGGGDLNFNRIVPGTIRSVMQGERPVIRSDGSFIRDYIYVKDAVRAYMHLAEKMDDASVHGMAFNFSNETQLTALGLVERIITVMGRNELAPVITNSAKGEIRHQYLSAARARKVLGWSPEYTIDEGLVETVEWYRDFLMEKCEIKAAL